MTNKPKSEVEEKSNSEEWGAWKFVSDMLDNPNEIGIYQTGKCYEQIHDFVVAQKAKAHQQGKDERDKEILKEIKLRLTDDEGDYYNYTLKDLRRFINK